MYGDLGKDVSALGASGYQDKAAAVASVYSTSHLLDTKEAEKRLKRYNALLLEYAKKANTSLEKLTQAQRDKFNREFARKEEERKAKSLKEQAEYYSKLAELEEDANKKSDYKRLARQKKLVSQLGDATSKAINGALQGIDHYMGTFSNYMGEIEARLQGSTTSYSRATGLIRTNLVTSPYVKQTEVFNKLKDLISEGIAYNVEQRAFLGAISKNIATTFSVANSTLLQLVRIQQADTTAARLGLEASLTKYFNAMFGDTSYLNQTFKTVSASLLGATSQLGYAGGVEYEYAVQKWLGSLGSVGVSESTLTSIAQGIGMLGTSDISGLASNQQLRNLLLMGAQRSGVSFGQAIQGGLGATDVNKLLGGIVSYIQEIARSENQLVRAQYANLFGITLSDMTAIMNLSSRDLANISRNMLSYSGALAEVTNQLDQVGGRLSLKTKIDTLVENALVGAAEKISGSAALYSGWTIADLMQKSGLDVAIPAIMGFDTKQTVAGIMKMGIAGGSLISNLVSGLSSALFGGGDLSGLGLNSWGGKQFTSRGGTTVSMAGRSTRTSSSFYMGAASESDIASGSIADVKQTEMYKSAAAEDSTSEIKDAIIDRIAPDVEAILDILRSWRINDIIKGASI